MDQQYLQHIATDGDRWDTLSTIYYADATAYEQIIRANTHILIHATLNAGTTVLIPIIEDMQSSKQPEDVPFWLRTENTSD